MNSMMDTLDHHRNSFTVFWRRWGWHKLPTKHWKHRLMQWFKGKDLTIGFHLHWLVLKNKKIRPRKKYIFHTFPASDGWHMVKRLMLLGFFEQIWLFLSLYLGWSYFYWPHLVIIAAYSVMWSVPFNYFYNKIWIVRGWVRGVWTEFIKVAGIKVPVNRDNDPYK
jgi:hypothetical protein